jgi:hypothetical protein
MLGRVIPTFPVIPALLPTRPMPPRACALVTTPPTRAPASATIINFFMFEVLFDSLVALNIHMAGVSPGIFSLLLGLVRCCRDRSKMTITANRQRILLWCTTDVVMW